MTTHELDDPRDALSVRCPICGVRAGFECVSLTAGHRHIARSPHLHRLDDARQVS